MKTQAFDVNSTTELFKRPQVQKQWTILCVDDEINILSALRRALRKETNYTLLTASSGQEALELLDRETVHLVISDQRMPEMPGSELLKEIKKRCPDTVRIMLSGYAEAHAILEAVNQGEIYRFLTKPWQEEELREAIRDCLSHYETCHEKQEAMVEIANKNERLEGLNHRLTQSVVEKCQVVRFFHQLLEKLPTPLFWVDDTGLITFSNQSLGQENGLLHQAREGHRIQDVLPPILTDAIEAVLMGALESTQVVLKDKTGSMECQLTGVGQSFIGSGCLVLIEPVSVENQLT